jgi:tRNA(Arg) A34 adenosine deaminase TadA
MLLTTVRLALPPWVAGVVSSSRTCDNDDARMALAIEVSRRNVDERTGGPFGAVVFGPDDHVVAVGVNCVLPLSCSVAHAEMMAFMLAQQTLGRARLNRDADDRPVGPYTLAASAQPCCQCYGAAVWAGIDRLLIGARAEDVVAETEFDEGPLPTDWVGQLERRGIEVVRDLHRDEARQVLRAYTLSGGARY